MSLENSAYFDIPIPQASSHLYMFYPIATGKMIQTHIGSASMLWHACLVNISSKKEYFYGDHVNVLILVIVLLS